MRSDRRSWIETQVRDAAARGEFDNLPGAGKPIENLDRNDDLWWIRDKLKRENLSYLPPVLELKRRVSTWLDQLGGVFSEPLVRHAVEAFNDEIRCMNRSTVSDPPSTLVPLDVEELVARWRAVRDAEPS